MASGTITGTHRGWTYRMYWSATTSVADNTSTVVIDHYLDCARTYALYIGERVASSTIGKDKQEVDTPAISTGGDTTIKLGTTTHKVAHDSDGTKSVTLKGIFDIKATLSGTYVTSITAEGDITLDTIARASQPSCVTWPEHTQNVGDFGTPIGIHMNRASDAFTHTVRYKYGDLSGVIAKNVTTGVEWTIPPSFMDRIPNDTSGSGTIYVDTYSGSTFVGTKYCGFTATVPASVKPSVTATLTDTTEAGEIYGKPVVGLSKIKVTTSPSLAYSSPIASTQITIDGATYATNTVTTDILRNSGSSRVTVVVTDKRGRKGSWGYTMTVLPHSRPWIKSLAVHRTDATGTENDQGDHVTATFSAQVDSMSAKNQANYTLRYKKTTDANWQTLDLADADNQFTLTDYAVRFEADIASSYDVELTVADRHHTATRSTSASTAFSLMDWHPSGTGIAFGKVSEHERTMDVALGFRLSGGINPIEIAEGDDLRADKYKVPGWYRCSLSDTAASLLDCPTVKAFTLEVLPNVPTTQRLTEYSADLNNYPRMWVRNYYDYQDKWGPWAEISTKQHRMGSRVSLIGQDSYMFPFDGYLVLRAHYSSGSYVNCTLCGSNANAGFVLTACSGATVNLVGNPTTVVFVRQYMTIKDIDTNNTSNNSLDFYYLY